MLGNGAIRDHEGDRVELWVEFGVLNLDQRQEEAWQSSLDHGMIFEAEPRDGLGLTSKPSLLSQVLGIERPYKVSQGDRACRLERSRGVKLRCSRCHIVPGDPRVVTNETSSIHRDQGLAGKGGR